MILRVVCLLLLASTPAFGQAGGTTTSSANPTAAPAAPVEAPAPVEVAPEPEEVPPKVVAPPRQPPKPRARPSRRSRPRTPVVQPQPSVPDAGVAAADAGASTPDAGVAHAGSSAQPERLVPPAASPLVERLGLILLLAVLLFVVMRVVGRVVARAAGEGRGWGLVASRVWSLFEVSVWMVAAILLVGSALGSEGNLVLYVLVGAIVLVTAAQWNALRDVAAGLVFASERPFDVGDVVRVGGVEGQVRRLRMRVLELETADGDRVQIPYREAVGTTDVRSGGRRVAHAVRVVLDLPDGADPSEALKLARELAASSPWSVLGVSPRVQLGSAPDGRPTVEIEGYAFDRTVQASLHADLLGGWRDVKRTLGER